MGDPKPRRCAGAAAGRPSCVRVNVCLRQSSTVSAGSGSPNNENALLQEQLSELLEKLAIAREVAGGPDWGCTPRGPVELEQIVNSIGCTIVSNEHPKSLIIFYFAV